MRNLRRLVWAGVVLAGAAPGAVGQTAGTATGGGLGTTTGGLGTATGGTATGGNTGSGTGTGGQDNGTPLGTLQAPPDLSLSTTGQASSAVAGNLFGQWYANPYYLGVWANNINPNSQPGGFGTPLSLGGGSGGRTGTTTTTRGTTGTGLTTRGGTNTAAAGRGVIVPLPRQIAYMAQARFPTPPVAAPQMTADLRGMIDRTAMIANPAGVQFQLDGRTVVLRGNVRDEEEARLVEGMVRLTPGVGQIRNELAFPPAQP